jgi:hypothetical protein
MAEENREKQSQLLLALREAVTLVQMILFKAIRADLEPVKPGSDKMELSMLAGSITNEVFGTPNPEPKFAAFRQENIGEIEQRLLSLKDNYSFLCRYITDALRIQALCDHQEGGDSSQTLVRARNFGYLLEDRQVPLPSTFMTIVRELGKQYNLVIPPVEISRDQDQQLIH